MVHGPLARVDFASTGARDRDVTRPVVLIGFRRAGNLGLGYLASTLRARGYQVEILEFEDTFENILGSIRRLDPILVGFSLIFQFYIGRYAAMIRALRSRGVTAHFTMGGHFPTLSFDHTMELVPELDSVVRFEGELTLLELVDALGVGQDWRAIHGVAYRRGVDVVATELRPLLPNLDELPYPDRGVELPMMLGRRVVQILASRGCIRTCSFCSIHMFYRSAPGKVVRTRRPAEVAREMRRLYDESDATIFSFQDDDFPVFGRVWQRWAREFVAELYRNDLPGRIIWKTPAPTQSIPPCLRRCATPACIWFTWAWSPAATKDL
jgi:anaerobic magnesium-protoporphyrin IX monomethyl ester cyclase